MSATAASTVTNVRADEWAIHDEVVRLREWGTDRAFPLVADARGPLTIGTGERCGLVVRDPARRASREHAHLERMHGRWCVVDRSSKNGLYIDGARREKAALVPGTELGLGGGVTLVAESARSIALRDVLARMLGWAPAQAGTVDLALRAARLAATRRGVLVLCGDQELVPLAVELHRHTLTDARPFVLCDPRRRTSQTSEHPERCVNDGRTALAEAPGGTVCLYEHRPPADLVQLLEGLRQPDCQTQLVVCTTSAQAAELFHPAPVVIPRLSSRPEELARIIEAYEEDAAARLGRSDFRLSPAEHLWLRTHAASSLADIQRTTLRLAAIHIAGSISAGALRVGISHTALIKWLRHRKFPRALLPTAASVEAAAPRGS